MSWSASWAAAALSATTSPVYVLRVLSDGPQPAWSSGRVTGAATCLLPTECSIQWGRTGPHQWSTPTSSATFALTPDADIEGVYQGSVVQLGIILNGEEQPVWVGSLQQMARTLTGPITLSCTGMEGALWSRMIEVGASGYERLFFPECNDVAVLAADYTAGVSTTLSIAGSPGLQKRTGSGGVYVVRVEPSVGDPFYIAGDTWSAPTLSDSGGTVYTVLDTTAVDAVTGDTVGVVAYDAAHPCALLARALGATSSWPDDWNMRLPAGVLDADEANAQIAASGLSASEQAAWVWLAEQPMERIGDTMLPLLSSSGVVLCQRQGMIAPRIIPRPDTIDAGSVPLVTAADIVDASWQAWAATPQALAYEVYDRTQRDPLNITTTEDITTPYGSLVYACTLLGIEPPPPPTSTGASLTQTTAGNDGGTLRGQPVQSTVQVRLPVYGGSSDRQAARQDVHIRMKWYSTTRPERLTITLRGWHGLAVGDAVRVDLPQLPCRGSGEGGITTGYPAVVVGGGPDFFGATTTLELLGVPGNTLT